MEVQLQHKQEFKALLANYQPSQEARDTLATMPLVILLSVTGGGRNTIINELTKTGRYHYIVSDTTQPPKVRNGALEQDGHRTGDAVVRHREVGPSIAVEIADRDPHCRRAADRGVVDGADEHAPGAAALQQDRDVAVGLVCHREIEAAIHVEVCDGDRDRSQ